MKPCIETSEEDIKWSKYYVEDIESMINSDFQSYINKFMENSYIENMNTMIKTEYRFVDNKYQFFIDYNDIIA